MRASLLAAAIAPSLGLVAACVAVDEPAAVLGLSDRAKAAAGSALLEPVLADDADAPLYDDPAAWPARWGEDRRGSKGVIVTAPGPLRAWRGSVLGRFHVLRPDTPDLADLEPLAAGIDDPEAPASAAAPVPAEFRLEGGRSFVFLRDRSVDLWQAGERPADAPDTEPIEIFRFVSGTLAHPGGTVTRPAPRVEVTRSWFALYAPSDAAIEDARGLVVIMPGLYGVPGFTIDALTAQARDRGWAVLRMLAPQPRFTEFGLMTIDVRADDALAETIAPVALEMQDRFAEQAYAVGAALAHVRTNHGELTALPWSILGMSGGAMSLPAATAWIDRSLGLTPDAAVLIAGGADALTITERSSYAGMVDALDLQWLTPESGDEPTNEPSTAAIVRASEAYLPRAPLDGYHAARSLEGVPTLVLHASNDRAVPAFTGDLLWERLGKPERWRVGMDHGLFFVTLWSRGPAVYDWIDGVLPDVDAGDAGAPG